jgi:2-polyprenyl-3-methyl-5-hydroxy-6-metoxy-1,4-benzoquinol methylase
MRIPEPPPIKFITTKLKNRFYHKGLILSVNGKRKKIRMLTNDEILHLQNYRFADRLLDVATELSEYSGEPIEKVRERMRCCDQKIDSDFIALGSKSEAEISKFYASHPEYIYHQMRVSADFLHLAKRTNLALSISLGLGKKTMMDFGAGTGRDCLTFAKKGFSATHCDCLGENSRFAQWRYQARGLNVRLLDPRELENDSTCYDVITCFDVLEHLVDPLKWVRIFYAKLKPEGVLFLATDFDNPGTPLHLPENVVYQNSLSSAMAEIGFLTVTVRGYKKEKIIWMKG